MTIDISRIKAICFDVDGTLRDTDDQYTARVASLIRPFRFLLHNRQTEATARWLVMRFEGPVNGFFGLADRLGLDGPLHRLIEGFNPWKRGDEGSNYRLVPGIQAALDILANHYPMAVVTARGARSTKSFLESTHLDVYFDIVASALTSPRGKPRPDPILWAAKKLDVSPENCLMVGDTVVDILAGKAAGAQTLGVLSGFGEEEELRDRGADLILPSVASLPGTLELA